MVLRAPQTGKSTPVASLGLAHAALRAGNSATARQMLQDRLADNPFDADALHMLADVAAGQRSFEEATILLRRAVAADPSPDRRIALIQHLQLYTNPATALTEIEQLPQAVRDRFEVRAIESGILGILGLHEQQIRLYQQMLRQQSDKPGLWVSLANALKTVGRTAEAIKALQRAIKVQPTYGDAWWTLANFKSYRFSTRDVREMNQALRGCRSPEDALHIHFALGKAYEDRGEYEPSFRHYAAGNEIRAATMPPEPKSMSERVDEWMDVLTPQFFDRGAPVGDPAPDPIFVVGLHRSGSTLLEQILASHPLIEGTTELSAMNNIRERLERSTGLDAPAAIDSLRPEQFADLGSQYLEKTRPFRQTDRPYFVDKMPSNWVNLPLIRLALPNAKIIDARRHPMACGFSNFKQNYATGLNFSYRLETIGAFYGDYWRFMRRFDEVQPGAVHRVLNERIIEDPEGEVRRMLDFIGVPFDPACLEFHKTARAIRTPSAEQVRKPINREGVDYWRHYEPWLDELKASLGPALEQWTG
ncbi:MAG: tetratricopeptide repeat-containing sulfotransferase family protein [Sphingomicrobium sp.]